MKQKRITNNLNDQDSCGLKEWNGNLGKSERVKSRKESNGNLGKNERVKSRAERVTIENWGKRFEWMNEYEDE